MSFKSSLSVYSWASHPCSWGSTLCPVGFHSNFNLNLLISSSTDLYLLSEVCFVRVGVKTYRMVDLQEQGWAALL